MKIAAQVVGGSGGGRMPSLLDAVPAPLRSSTKQVSRTLMCVLKSCLKTGWPAGSALRG